MIATFFKAASTDANVHRTWVSCLSLGFFMVTLLACASEGSQVDGIEKHAGCATVDEVVVRAGACKSIFDRSFEQVVRDLVNTVHNPGVRFGMISATAYVGVQEEGVADHDLQTRLENLGTCTQWALEVSASRVMKQPMDVRLRPPTPARTNPEHYLDLHPDVGNSGFRAGVAVRGRGTRVALPSRTPVRVLKQVLSDEGPSPFEPLMPSEASVHGRFDRFALRLPVLWREVVLPEGVRIGRANLQEYLEPRHREPYQDVWVFDPPTGVVVIWGEGNVREPFYQTYHATPTREDMVDSLRYIYSGGIYR